MPLPAGRLGRLNLQHRTRRRSEAKQPLGPGNLDRRAQGRRRVGIEAAPPAQPAGFLGALNPFVYDRLVEGQWYVVIAAAGLFLWLAAWEALQARPGFRRAALLAVCGAAIVSFDPHSIGPLALLTFVAASWTRIW